MSDIKALLKEAREAADKKDYQTCYKLSRAILKEDRNNYMALVFLGLALQEVGSSEKAIKAFEKAIELNPSNSLAWNGLISYYEKNNSEESKRKLIKLYSTVLFLERSQKKIFEYCEKLGNLHDLGDIEEISKTIYNCSKNDKVEDQNAIYKILVKLFQQMKNFPPPLNDMYEECLSHLIKFEPYRFEYCSIYLNLLYKNKKIESLLYHIEQMYNGCLEEIEYLTWICRIFNDCYIEELELAKNMFDKVINCYPRLLNIDPKNSIGLLSKSITLIKSEELINAKDTLEQVVFHQSELLHAWILLTNVYVKLKWWEQASESTLISRGLLSSVNNSSDPLKSILDVISVQILSESSDIEDWKKALELYKSINNAQLKEKCLEFIIQININLERFEEANLLILELKIYKPVTWFLLYAKLLRKQKQYQVALDLLENHPMPVLDWWIEIGLLYLDMEEYQKCLVILLKAAKCHPNNFLPFLYLGKVYKMLDNLNKSRRCYEKAIRINPMSSEIVIELCKIYRQLKNWDATHSLLENITSSTINEKNSWAWLELGLSYLEQEDYSSAINNLQVVTRIQSNNIHCWEALADAYFARGSYTSAQKCYEKSLELSSNSLHSLLQIANIKMILQHYVEAQIDFEKILHENEQYIPALLGLAESFILQAKQYYNDQRLGASRDYIQITVEKIILGIHKRSDLSCLWKLLADSCLFVANLPEKYSWILFPKYFLECSNSKTIDVVKRHGLFHIATRCYCKAIDLTEDDILIRHDLATCYVYHAANAKDEDEVQQLLGYAIAASQYCTFIDPSNWQHWNLLGNIAIKNSPPNYALAQHSFIRAVMVNHNSAVSWTNLGVLYILLNNFKLANKAFAHGQRSDPNYVNSWVGQALLAEIMEHDEAMDLFRHSIHLGQNQQGGLGYAYWVCKTLLAAPADKNIYSIHNMRAIVIACDALTWYTEKNPYDGCAWNMLGILKERLGFKGNTIHSYHKAYKFSEEKNCDLTRINYGRILAKLEKYSEAVKIFNEIKEATFKSCSGLALALFKDKHYEEAYNAYEQVLHWLSNEQTDQSDILVALASIAYMFQGVNAAKELLFQSILLKPPSPWSLYATLSLALIHNDLELAALVSNELELYRNENRCLKHYAFLKSCTYLHQKRHDKAVKEVSKIIHKHPNDPSVWTTLSLLLLRVAKEKNMYIPAAKCGQVAITLGKIDLDSTKVLCMVSLASSLANNTHQAFIAAQKAVHCYPDVAECWSVLIVTSSNMRNMYPCDNKIRTIFSYMENLNPSPGMLHWIRTHKSV